MSRRSGNRCRIRATVSSKKSPAISIGTYNRGLSSASIKISVLIPAPAPYSNRTAFSPQKSAISRALSAQNGRFRARRVIFLQPRDFFEDLAAADCHRATGSAAFSGLETDRSRRPPERPPAAAFVGLQFRAFRCPPPAAARRTATARPGERSSDNSAEYGPAGVTQEPPRNTNWPHMNLPLYSPTAPSTARNRG